MWIILYLRGQLRAVVYWQVLVHGIDGIPIICWPLQGAYPIGRCRNTRPALYTRQFVHPVRGGGGVMHTGHYNAPVYYLRGMAAWFSRGGNISTPRGVSSFGYWLPFIMEHNSTLSSLFAPFPTTLSLFFLFSPFIFADRA